MSHFLILWERRQLVAQGKRESLRVLPNMSMHSKGFQLLQTITTTERKLQTPTRDASKNRPCYRQGRMNH